jgi:hypothetical protein
MTATHLLGRRFAVVPVCAAWLAGAAIAATADDRAEAGGARHVEVFKPDGSRQCEPDSGLPPQDMRAELEAAGIIVYATRSGPDGTMYLQVCGAPTGRINIFTIDAAALDAAQTLGFLPRATLN